MKKLNTRVIVSRQYKDWNKLKDLTDLFRRALFYMHKINILPSRQCRVEVLLGDDSTLHRLNSDFRNKDSTTDVLSFKDGTIHRQTLFLGEIAISFQQVQNQARIMKSANAKTPIITSDKPSIEAVFARSTHLFIHGILHLLNHEHSTNSGAEKMESIEISIMKSLGYENPYTN